TGNDLEQKRVVTIKRGRDAGHDAENAGEGAAATAAALCDEIWSEWYGPQDQTDDRDRKQLANDGFQLTAQPIALVQIRIGVVVGYQRHRHHSGSNRCDGKQED